MRMTDDELAAIESRATKATPGPRMKLSDHLRTHSLVCFRAIGDGLSVDLEEHAHLFGEAAWKIERLEAALRELLHALRFEYPSSEMIKRAKAALEVTE